MQLSGASRVAVYWCCQHPVKHRGGSGVSAVGPACSVSVSGLKGGL